MSEEFFRVIKVQSHKFVVDHCGIAAIYSAKKKNKENSVLVGDLVTIENGVIASVLTRRNKLIRPAIANIDQIIIVVSSLPEPDFYMLDKMLVNCCYNDIEALICVNKCDINDNGLISKVHNQYNCWDIIETDALHNKITPLRVLLDGKVTCLAGQSAVGKSTLINAVLGFCVRNTGELSAIERGKNTTTDTELFFAHNGWIADTPGFSLLDIFDVDPYELDLFYPEFKGFLNECKFHRCTHTGEPGCAVCAAAKNGQINLERFNRYIDLFNELKESKKNQWKRERSK